MTDEPKKFGVISCSGEEYPEGTISRIATRLVMDKLRPGETTTLCLPLFLTGGGHEREFAKTFPTITVDGCSKRCAERATRKYSGEPVASIVVSDVMRQHECPKLTGRDELDAEGQKVVGWVAQAIVSAIDKQGPSEK